MPAGSKRALASNRPNDPPALAASRSGVVPSDVRDAVGSAPAAMSAAIRSMSGRAQLQAKCRAVSPAKSTSSSRHKLYKGLTGIMANLESCLCRHVHHEHHSTMVDGMANRGKLGL